MTKLPEYKTILYATDLGDHTRPVFRQAVSLARAYRGRIVMLHVVEPIGPTGRAVIDAYLPRLDTAKLEREGLQEILEKMKQRLQAFCDQEVEACEGHSALVSEVVVATGHPSEEIVSTAEQHGADLIVMGSCTHALFGHPTLGSTARKVSQHTTIPLLVVPNCAR